MNEAYPDTEAVKEHMTTARKLAMKIVNDERLSDTEAVLCLGRIF